MEGIIPGDDRVDRAAVPDITPLADGRRLIVVRLTRAPSTIWRRAFEYGIPRPPVFYPDLIRFADSTLAVTSAERDLITWLACLDAWIAEANQRCTDYARGSSRSEGGTLA